MKWFDEDFAPHLGIRERTMREVTAHLLGLHRPVQIVETGCVRKLGNWSDGQSTFLWDRITRIAGGRFTSIDVDTAAIALAREALPRGFYSTADSVFTLNQMDLSNVDLLYLDSHDFVAHDPYPSAIHHVMELTAAWHKLPRGCLIMVDDCHERFFGKHMLVHRFFCHIHVAPLHTGYQYIWRKP